jgi:hypothetical protein
MPQQANQWTVKDFEDMNIGQILDVRQENGCVTLILANCRIKFKNWK